MIRIKLTGNALDHKGSIAFLMEKVMGELQSGPSRSCTVCMDVSGTPFDIKEIKFRITYLGASRPKRRPAMTRKDEGKQR